MDGVSNKLVAVTTMGESLVHQADRLLTSYTQLHLHTESIGKCAETTNEVSFFKHSGNHLGFPN